MSERIFGDLPLRFLARVTIQFRTPFVVRSGRLSGPSQKAFVRDANGLPALPGSSITGVLRHAYGAARGFQAAEDLFGQQLSDGVAEGTRTMASRLAVSWGAVHGQDDVPVEGLHSALPTDPVLAAAMKGNLRDHVAIDGRGAADGRRKFDETVVGAGHRFTFELLLAGDDADRPAWTDLLGLLQWTGLRFGAGSRRGFGAFDVVRLQEGRFDLRDEADYRAFCAVPRDLGASPGLMATKVPAIVPSRSIEVRLKALRAVGPWLFGGGQGSEDISPVAETVVGWGMDGGAISAEPLFYLPAASIKGALAHRVAWHYNRLAGLRADAPGVVAADHVGRANATVRALFGEIKEDDGSGSRGLLMFEDVFVPAGTVSPTTFWHVSLDRFTGSARAGLLFTESALGRTNLGDYVISIVASDGAGPTPRVKHSLAAALDDVRRGRLPFGAGGGRGNGGFVCAAVEWNDDGAWLEEGGP